MFSLSLGVGHPYGRLAAGLLPRCRRTRTTTTSPRPALGERPRRHRRPRKTCMASTPTSHSTPTEQRRTLSRRPAFLQACAPSRHTDARVSTRPLSPAQPPPPPPWHPPAAGPRAGGRLQGGGRGRWLASPSGAACGGPHHKVGGLLGPSREQSSSRLSSHLSRLTSRTVRSQVVRNTELKFLVRAPWLLGLFVPPPAWPSEHLTVQAAPAQRFSIRD